MAGRPAGSFEETQRYIEQGFLFFQAPSDLALFETGAQQFLGPHGIRPLAPAAHVALTPWPLTRRLRSTVAKRTTNGGSSPCCGDLVLQLRRPPGDLLGVSAARTRDAPDAGAARPARVGVRVGLRAGRAACRHGRRPRRAARRRSSAACMRGASSAWRRSSSRNFRHLFLFRAAEGLGRDVLLSRRRCRSSATITAARRARGRWGCTRRAVYVGTIGGGFFAGLIGRALRLAAVVRRVRRARRPARARAARASSSSRRAARRTSPRQPARHGAPVDAALGSRCRVPAARRRARRRCSA